MLYCPAWLGLSTSNRAAKLFSRRLGLISKKGETLDKIPKKGKRGRPWPEGKIFPHKLHIRIDDDVKMAAEELREFSRRRDPSTSLSDIVRDLIKRRHALLVRTGRMSRDPEP